MLGQLVDLQKELLSGGANPRVVNTKTGSTLLHEARDEGLVVALLAAGAEVDALDKVTLMTSELILPSSVWLPNTIPAITPPPSTMT